jgi:hypothetical protein
MLTVRNAIGRNNQKKLQDMKIQKAKTKEEEVEFLKKREIAFA